MEPVRIALPPDELMVAVVGHANHAEFERSRCSGASQVLKDLEAASIDSTRLVDVLDFGCGCGRLLAGWMMLGSHFRLHGCDYNPALVQWCNEAIPGVLVQRNQMGETLPYSANSFDLIYLVSIFTHLTLAKQRRLVPEFHRILRSEGYAYLTFHGGHYYPSMAPTVLKRLRFKLGGFLIHGQDREGTNDCWTLHSVEKLVRIFDGFVPVKHFESVRRGPTDVAGWQDSLILRKSSN